VGVKVNTLEYGKRGEIPPPSYLSPKGNKIRLRKRKGEVEPWSIVKGE
jgi:hypothetical protein